MAATWHDLLVLQALVSACKADEKSLWNVASEAVEALILRAACSCISLWRFELVAGRRQLRCFASKVPGGDLTADASRPCELWYRGYFAALVRTGVLAVNDTRVEASLQAMRGSHLDQHRIGALRDVAVMINGRAHGIVCCGRIPGPRDWKPEEVIAVRAAVLLAVELSADTGTLASVPIKPF